MKGFTLPSVAPPGLTSGVYLFPWLHRGLRSAAPPGLTRGAASISTDASVGGAISHRRGCVINGCEQPIRAGVCRPSGANEWGCPCSHGAIVGYGLPPLRGCRTDY